jgi:hypothetical protein
MGLCAFCEDCDKKETNPYQQDYCDSCKSELRDFERRYRK